MLLAVAIVLVVVGFVGIVVPAMPGTVLVFAGLLLAAWSDGFLRVGALTLVALGVLTAGSYLIDFATVAVGMKRLGTTKQAMVGAAIGVVAGLFFGIPGLILGPFIGAVTGELLARRDLRGAGRAGLAAWLGFLLGTVAKMALAFAMVGIFLAAWFWN